MAKSKEPYSKGKWHSKDNFVCNGKGCKFATLDEKLVKIHVAKNHAPAVPQADNPPTTGKKPPAESKK